MQYLRHTKTYEDDCDKKPMNILPRLRKKTIE